MLKKEYEITIKGGAIQGSAFLGTIKQGENLINEIIIKLLKDDGQLITPADEVTIYFHARRLDKKGGYIPLFYDSNKQVWRGEIPKFYTLVSGRLECSIEYRLLKESLGDESYMTVVDTETGETVLPDKLYIEVSDMFSFNVERSSVSDDQIDSLEPDAFLELEYRVDTLSADFPQVKKDIERFSDNGITIKDIYFTRPKSQTILIGEQYVDPYPSGQDESILECHIISDSINEYFIGRIEGNYGDITLIPNYVPKIGDNRDKRNSFSFAINLFDGEGNKIESREKLIFKIDGDDLEGDSLGNIRIHKVIDWYAFCHEALKPQVLVPTSYTKITAHITNNLVRDWSEGEVSSTDVENSSFWNKYFGHSHKNNLLPKFNINLKQINMNGMPISLLYAFGSDAKVTPKTYKLMNSHRKANDRNVIGYYYDYPDFMGGVGAFRRDVITTPLLRTGGRKELDIYIRDSNQDGEREFGFNRNVTHNVIHGMQGNGNQITHSGNTKQRYCSMKFGFAVMDPNWRNISTPNDSMFIKRFPLSKEIINIRSSIYYNRLKEQLGYLNASTINRKSH